MGIGLCSVACLSCHSYLDLADQSRWVDETIKPKPFLRFGVDRGIDISTEGG